MYPAGGSTRSLDIARALVSASSLAVSEDGQWWGRVHIRSVQVLQRVRSGEFLAVIVRGTSAALVSRGREYCWFSIYKCCLTCGVLFHVSSSGCIGDASG